jgi:hypothetical protein
MNSFKPTLLVVHIKETVRPVMDFVIQVFIQMRVAETLVFGPTLSLLPTL